MAPSAKAVRKTSLTELHYKVIPHDEHRYDTPGDYWTDVDGIEQFRVSRMHDERYEHLVLIHELVERILCHHWGISNRSIDNFDLKWKGKGEPGDDHNAPYWEAHQIASAVERLMAAELGVDWNEYDRAVSKL